ncbi:CG32801 [Drosophila busckii]|uniref:CG32801 n=1 Tax=Drosophila busckii TaxID=30019 RepID=A0A0M4F9Y6_DROBS|nr:uncharacterized protein LOC108605341 [Drosophila busckii]ALC49450.1 CG32801 [Drosophila busckii]
MKPKAALPSGEDDDGDSQQNDHYEGDPLPLPYAFEKELIDKSNRHIRLCKDFGSSKKVYPITTKFYAKYEPQPILLQPAQSKLPVYPLLESQVYGWIPLQCQELAIYLNGVQAPKLRCRMTIHGEHITAGRITERPPFNGLQFVLH